jgi:hypothetical protein
MCLIPPLPDSQGIRKHLQVLWNAKRIIPELSNCRNVFRLNDFDFEGGLRAELLLVRPLTGPK